MEKTQEEMIQELKEKERVRDNIYSLQDKLNEFFYATDYFGLSEEVETEEVKKILSTFKN